VHDALFVGLGQGGRDLAHHVEGSPDRQGALPPEGLLEIAPFEELHREVERAVLDLPEVVDPDGVRVVQAADRQGLDLEALDDLLVPGQFPEQHLDRHRPIDAGLAGPVHDAHPPGADPGLDQEAPVDQAPDHRVGHRIRRPRQGHRRHLRRDPRLDVPGLQGGRPGIGRDVPGDVGPRRCPGFRDRLRGPLPTFLGLLPAQRAIVGHRASPERWRTPPGPFPCRPPDPPH